MPDSSFDDAPPPERRDPPPRKTFDNPIDAAFSAVRFHHVFLAALLFLFGALAYGAPALTILPAYLALVAREPAAAIQRRYGLSFAGAVLAVAGLAFLLLAATALAIFLPLLLQALKLDADTIQSARPMIGELTAWARETLASLGVDPTTIEQTMEQSGDELISGLLGSDGRALVGAATRALLQPVLLVALAFLIVFMASYALGYSAKLRDEGGRLLRLCLPHRSVWIVERLVTHTQSYGAAVLRGYSWMVLVLGVFYFIVYLGSIALFEEATALPPLFVIALIVLSGVIGAIPGLGAKLLLVVGAVAGLIVAVAAAVFTGNFWLGVYIFVAIVVVTGFESKFGTPMTLGRALGVNSALMLFIAIAAVAAYGVGTTLWAIFVILPIMAAGARVMRELNAASVAQPPSVTAGRGPRLTAPPSEIERPPL